MKKNVLLIVFCLSALGSMAQSPIDFGFHGGWNNTKIDLKEFKVSSHNGYMFGAFLRINIADFYLEPALNFSHRESMVEKTDTEIKVKYSAVDIPVMVGYSLINTAVFRLRGFAGPVASILTDKLKIKELYDNLKSDKTMWSGRVGAGIDLWKITFDAGYEFGLKKFSNEVKAPATLNLKVGFKLL